MRKVFLLLLAPAMLAVRSDVVECENGDRYNGKVLTVDENTVKLTNEITGVLNIPRAKVATISFGNTKLSKATAVAVPAKTNLNVLSATQPPQFDVNAVEQVQNQLLGDASPEATQMFQEMVRGLMSGKLDLGDVRNKAQSTLNELKDLQKDLGDDDTTALLSSYASILQNFLNQAPANTKPQTPKAPAQTAAEE
jgi:hypothetical protein